MKAAVVYLLAVAPFAGTAALGGELLTNPDFEGGTAGWFESSCSISAETSRVLSGSGAMYVCHRSQPTHSGRQDVTSALAASGPGSYTLRAYAMDAVSGSVARLRVRLKYGGNDYYLGPNKDIVTNRWTEVSAVQSLSWTGTLELAQFYVANSDPHASYYIDECSLWIADSPETNSTPIATNDVPYVESLETYMDGTLLFNTNGWSSRELDAPMVMASTYSYTGARPTAVKHEQVLDLGGSITNFFQCSEVHTNVLLDTMLRPTLRTSEGHPAVDPGAHACFYFNSNGVLTVRHAVYADGFTTVSNHWTPLSHTPIADGQWVRLTVRVDYLSDGLRGDKYFAIALDGQPELTHALAYKTVSPASEASDMDGKWFLCPNSGMGGGSDSFSGFILDGTARLDDVVVSDPLRTTSRGTAHAWLESHYPISDYDHLDVLDTDGDGMLTWQEYLAGTDPTRADSVFCCAWAAAVDGSFEVMWLGSPDGAHTPYVMYRSTNLLEGATGWVLVDDCIPRSYSGLNVWIDPSPPLSPSVYYRLAAPSE